VRSRSIAAAISPGVTSATLSPFSVRPAYAPNVVPQAAYVVGRDPRSFFTDGFSLDRLPRYEVTPEGERTLAVRLHLRDAAPLPGDSDEDRAALARFRKLAETPEEGPGPGGAPVKFLKLFEVVP
jgi:hypothetical protein